MRKRRRKSIRDVRSLPATCSRGNRIHQSPTLSCHLLQIKRIICTASKPDIPAGPALKNTKNSTWSQKHKTERAAYCRKTPFDSTNEKVEKKLANIFYIYLNFFIWREKKQIKKKKPKTATTIAEWPLSQLTPHVINLVHFNWIQLCQDLPWLIKHLSAGNEANRKRSVKHILNTVGTIYLRQRVIPAKQPDYKQHENAEEREEKHQWDWLITRAPVWALQTNYCSIHHHNSST